MEAEQYTSDAICGLRRSSSREHSPNAFGTPADAIIGLSLESPHKANAQFIRPFDLGVHTFKEKRSIVN